MRTTATAPTTVADRPEPTSDADDLLVMTMLQEHVPLSLIIDLTDPTGPVSAEILLEEGAPATRWWES